MGGLAPGVIQFRYARPGVGRVIRVSLGNPPTVVVDPEVFDAVVSALYLLVTGTSPLVDVGGIRPGTVISLGLPDRRELCRQWGIDGAEACSTSWLPSTATAADHAAAMLPLFGATEAQRHALCESWTAPWNTADWDATLPEMALDCAEVPAGDADVEHLLLARIAQRWVDGAWTAVEDHDLLPPDIPTDGDAILAEVRRILAEGGLRAVADYARQRIATLTEMSHSAIFRLRATLSQAEAAERAAQHAHATCLVALEEAMHGPTLRAEQELAERLRQLARLDVQRSHMDGLRMEQRRLERMGEDAARRQCPPYGPLVACERELHQIEDRLLRLPVPQGFALQPEALTQQIHAVEDRIAALRTRTGSGATVQRLEADVAAMRWHLWNLWEWETGVSGVSGASERAALEDRAAVLRIRRLDEERAAEREYQAWEATREIAARARATRIAEIDAEWARYEHECTALRALISDLRLRTQEPGAPDAIAACELALGRAAEAATTASAHASALRGRIRSQTLTTALTEPFVAIVRAAAETALLWVLTKGGWLGHLDRLWSAVDRASHLALVDRDGCLTLGRTGVGHDKPVHAAAWFPFVMQAGLRLCAAPDIGIVLLDARQCGPVALARICDAFADLPRQVGLILRPHSEVEATIQATA